VLGDPIDGVSRPDRLAVRPYRHRILKKVTKGRAEWLVKDRVGTAPTGLNVMCVLVPSIASATADSMLGYYPFLPAGRMGLAGRMGMAGLSAARACRRMGACDEDGRQVGGWTSVRKIGGWWLEWVGAQVIP
jgi:hypothetical protein